MSQSHITNQHICQLQINRNKGLSIINSVIIPNTWSGPILSVLRIVTGLLFLAHGTAKLVQWTYVDMFSFDEAAGHDPAEFFQLPRSLRSFDQ